jgi:hypothetical protein
MEMSSQLLSAFQTKQSIVTFRTET